MGSGLRKAIRNALVRAGGTMTYLGGRVAGKRALAFHEVPDPERFGDFLDRLAAEYELLALEAWIRDPLGRRTQLTLTFDDGYASWHEAVAPLLEQRGIPATFFVSSGLVGLQGEEAREFARRRLHRTQELRFIGRSQLAALAAHPLFEVGSHTCSHADLGSVSDRAALRGEVERDRATLQDWLASEVRWFAYPFGGPGNVPTIARATVEDVGLEAAFTLVPGWWRPDRGDRFMIGRDSVDPALPFSLWQAWLRGGYDRIYRLKSARPFRSSRSISGYTASGR